MKLATWASLCLSSVGAFVMPPNRRLSVSFHSDVSHTSATALQLSSSPVTVENEVNRLRSEAARMRLEAERMEMSVTLDQISKIENKLKNPNWIKKHPDDTERLQEQIKSLRKRLEKDGGNDDNPSSSRMRNSFSAPKVQTVETLTSVSSEKPPSSNNINAISIQSDETSTIIPAIPEHPISSFDEEDLEVYMPVAQRIQEEMPGADAEEQLIAFRAAPELQEYFGRKIRRVLVEPMEEVQQLESLREQYLNSSSRKEKDQLKRQIDKLTKEVEENGPFQYSDNVYIETPVMPEQEYQLRLEILSGYPLALQALYTKRTGAPSTDDLRLAIDLEHYSNQLQLLEQVKYISPLDDDMLAQTQKAVASLPPSVQKHVATNEGLESDSTVENIVKALTDWNSETRDDGNVLSIRETIESLAFDDSDNYDIEYVDRSRFLEEFFPSVARMEGLQPSLEDVERFSNEVIDKKAFMVTSKPERVMGGYYIRGENKMEDDEFGVKLVERLRASLGVSDLKDSLQFFYVVDPAPQADEDLELGYEEQPILIVTGVDSASFYDHTTPVTKAGITALGALAIILFASSACEMQPSLATQIEANPYILLDTILPIICPLLGIQLIHEIGHKFIAIRDDFRTNWPTLVPSIQTGLMGAITSLASPPPNLRSLFDFGMVGPALGFLTSLGFLVVGLDMTASADAAQAASFPGLPAFLLHSSALGGGLTELFLGRGIVSIGVTEESIVALHPFAVAGFAGLMSNAVALLPLGHTDGGRVALAMFGRRGAFVVNIFSALLVCAAGLFGLDEARVLLIYILFAFLWQRDLETPVINEVEELDFVRGGIAIGAALLVFLTILPIL